MRPVRFESPSEENKCPNFSCGDGDIDKWHRNHSLKDHSKNKHVVTCAYFDDVPDPMLGLYALSTVIEETKELPDDRFIRFFPFGGTIQFPCVQLVYMAVHSQHQCNGYGALLIGRMIREFVASATKMGIPAMILTPMNDRAAKFYTRHGFVPYGQNKRMILPLQKAEDDLRQVLAS